MFIRKIGMKYLVVLRQNIITLAKNVTEIFPIANPGCMFIIKTDLKMITGNRIWKFYVMIVIKQSIITK